jgi:hypothetical protein
MEAKALVEKAPEDEKEEKVAIEKVVAKAMAAEQRAVDEATTKAVEEEQGKRDEEDLDNDTSPMDIYIPETTV